jgi:hypothetical protein
MPCSHGFSRYQKALSYLPKQIVMLEVKRLRSRRGFYFLPLPSFAAGMPVARTAAVEQLAGCSCCLLEPALEIAEGQAP